MIMDDESFINVIKQQTEMTMDELDLRFKGRAARTRGLGSAPQIIEDVSINRHHGVIFRFAGSVVWLTRQQIEFINPFNESQNHDKT